MEENKIVTREDMLKEALERMKILKLHSNTLKELKNENKVNQSENNGVLYWVKEDIAEKIKEFEECENCLVYHVVFNNTRIGELYSFLYVSENEEEWKLDKQDLKEGIAFAYVYNKDDDYCSEFGRIEIEPCIGGLRRVN